MVNKKKIMGTLYAIIAMTFVCFIVNFPQQIPISIHLGRINYEHTFYRPSFKFNVGDKEYGKDLDLKYGLDLAGGASLVFEIDTSTTKKEDVSDALSALKSNIEKRINLFGVSETNVKTLKQNNNYRLNVELPGVEDISSAVDLIGQTAQLKFQGVVDDTLFTEATTSAEFYSSLKDTGLDGSHLIKASVQLNPNTSEPEVSLEFNETGAKLFETATTEFLDKKLAIMLDDQVITAPNVNVVIADGKAVISGSFDTASAKALSIQLNAGSLKLPINLIQQSQITATLGRDSVEKGIFAGIIGIILVFVFMIGNYGWLGFISGISLIIYGLVTLTLYRLIPVTLTFPGIVGFLLSIGMAVDSNILIFERMREETRKGKNWSNAMELGFGRAWDSIKDANACTIITGLILLNPFNWPFLNTSGMVRGFAVTLILGVIIGIFTGVVVTRNLLRVFAKEKIKN